MDKEEDSKLLKASLLKVVAKHMPESRISEKAELVNDLYKEVYKWATGETDEEFEKADGAGTVEYFTMDIDGSGTLKFNNN